MQHGDATTPYYAPYTVADLVASSEIHIGGHFHSGNVKCTECGKFHSTEHSGQTARAACVQEVQREARAALVERVLSTPAPTRYFAASLRRGLAKTKKARAMTARAQFHTVVFDLDDTLIDGDTGKVPKQTHHLLRKLRDAGVRMAIISSNPKADLYASLLGLSRFVGTVLTQGGCESRASLFGRALDALRVSRTDVTGVLHCDDGARNLAEVKTCFPGVQLHLCRDVARLFQILPTKDGAVPVEARGVVLKDGGLEVGRVVLDD
jgi:hypothetical protein